MPIPGSTLNTPINISGAASLWPDLCTIQDKNDTTDGAGSPHAGVPTNVSGMVNVRARLGPLILIRPTDSEDRTSPITRQDENRHLSLFGYFPNIIPSTQQAVVGSETFRILGVEFDGNRKTTRLRVTIVRP